MFAIYPLTYATISIASFAIDFMVKGSVNNFPIRHDPSGSIGIFGLHLLTCLYNIRSDLATHLTYLPLFLLLLTL